MSSTPADGSNRRVFGNIQINNSEQIVAQHEKIISRPGGGATFYTEVRRWDGNSFESGLLVARGDFVQGAGDFYRILRGTGINNSGLSVLLGGQYSGYTVLAVGTGAPFSTALANNFNSQANPMIAEGSSPANY